MTDIKQWVWIADKEKMICRNIENNVTVKMEKKGNKIKGKIQDMPMELFGELAGFENGEKIIMQIVKMAEEEYGKR